MYPYGGVFYPADFRDISPNFGESIKDFVMGTVREGMNFPIVHQVCSYLCTTVLKNIFIGVIFIKKDLGYQQ